MLPSLALLSFCSTLFSQDARDNAADANTLEAGGFDLQLTAQMPKSVKIASNGGADYNSETGQLRYADGVQIEADNGMQLFADKASIDTIKKQITLSGNVSIFQGNVFHRGEKAVYDYGKKLLQTRKLRTAVAPILLDSDSFSAVQENGETVFVGENAGITTHDVTSPNYWVRANKVSVYPNDKVVFNDLKLYLGETPVFWLPYFSQPLDAELGYHFIPGGRSNWGTYLLNRYGIMLGGEKNAITGKREDQWLLSQWLVDLRSRRGLGTGVDLIDTRLDSNQNLGWLKLYYANDLDPSIERSGVDRDFVNEDRYRIEFKHRFELDSSVSHTTLFDINLTWLSDRYYLEDFEPRTYTVNPEPENLLGIQRRGEYYQLGAFTRFQLNDFYQADSRLPEVYFDQVKRPLWGSGILHEGSTSLGYYREDLADHVASDLRQEASNPLTSPERVDAIDRILGRNDFARFHTYQEVTRPIELADGFSLTPRAGLGFTQYWDEGEEDNSFSSTHMYAGLDASMKFTKRYSQARCDTLGVNELLHVIQPYANLSILSTDELDPYSSRIDRLTPTERPRPIDVARYSAIDEYNNWSITRLGVRNQLMTKRNGGSHAWLTLDSYIDAFLNDPELNRKFSNVYNDIHWYPVPWAGLSLETQFPVTSSGFTEISTQLDFMPNENIELEFGHRYLHDNPTLLDSNRVDIRSYFRISNGWGFGTYHQWELDDSTLERQQYTLHRNHESWTTSIGFFHRDNREKDEFGAMLNFTLRALPQLSLPVSVDAS